jgi:hypothetical protein
MYNLETFYPTVSTWFRKTYDHLKPAVVYPYPYGSDNPDDTVFDCDYEFPDTVLLLYDQEPFWSSIRWLDHWAPRFAEWGSTVVLITTQSWGTNLDHYVQKYNWRTVCYQHHYVAARDWFRGYRNHPLRQRVDQRSPTHHFSCYNRLFAENRPHRLQLLADLYDNDLLEKTAISFPSHDPLTDQSYSDVTGRNDIQKILPLTIDDVQHSNNSHSIDIETANTCAVQLVTETVHDINENYLSEKIYKPMVLRQPFIVFGPPHSLQTLHNMGYKTFSTFWPEGYDDIIEHDTRYNAAFNIVKRLGKMHINEIEDVLHDLRMQSVLEHNHQWFFMQHTLDKVICGLFRDIELVIPT